jgi:hypothetical protein
MSNKFNSWQAGLQLIDCTMNTFVNRYIIRAKIRHTPGFKNIGHYDYFLLDELQKLSERLYGFPLEDWWPNTLSTHLPVKEMMGVIPITHPREWERVEESSISHLSSDLKFLAKRQKSTVISLSYNVQIPILPVSTAEEKQRFTREFVKVSLKNNRSAEPDFDEFARLWNAQGCDGVTIFKKSSYHLQRHWKISTRELEVKFAKRTLIQTGGSRVLARDLILSHYTDAERHCNDPPVIAPVVAEEEIETVGPSFASCGTNTSPEKRPMNTLVNLDTMAGASGQQPQQNPLRKKRKCRTCSSTTCQGLNSRAQDKCLGIINEV